MKGDYTIDILPGPTFENLTNPLVSDAPISLDPTDITDDNRLLSKLFYIKPEHLVVSLHVRLFVMRRERDVSEPRKRSHNLLLLMFISKQPT